MVTFFAVGLFLWLGLYAADQRIVLRGLKKDLSAYLDNAEEVVRIADDPRVLIHYKAVVFAISSIYNDYFPVRD